MSVDDDLDTHIFFFCLIFLFYCFAGTHDEAFPAAFRGSLCLLGGVTMLESSPKNSRHWLVKKQYCQPNGKSIGSHDDAAIVGGWVVGWCVGVQKCYGFFLMIIWLVEQGLEPSSEMEGGFATFSLSSRIHLVHHPNHIICTKSLIVIA